VHATSYVKSWLEIQRLSCCHVICEGSSHFLSYMSWLEIQYLSHELTGNTVSLMLPRHLWRIDCKYSVSHMNSRAVVTGNTVSLAWVDWKYSVSDMNLGRITVSFTWIHVLFWLEIQCLSHELTGNAVFLAWVDWKYSVSDMNLGRNTVSFTWIHVLFWVEIQCL